MFLGVRGVVALAVACATVAACSSAPDAEDAPQAEAAVSSLDPEVSPFVAITEPAALRALEQRGFGAGDAFGAGKDATADKLAATPAYATIAREIEQRLDALVKDDRSLAVGMSSSHRLFDRKWLRSPRSRFVLVAVTNRLDVASPGDCGEIHSVYRLDYDDPRPGARSRMPMTLLLTAPQKPRAGETGCAETAKRWLALEGRSGEALAGAALDGPLADRPRIAKAASNLQAVRWPSAVRRDMGGEAEYMLLQWRVGAAGAAIEPLENTPDVDAIKRDPEKRQRLTRWIGDHLDEIDRGSAVLPPELSATTAYSYGPRGAARLANRPFGRIFGDGAATFGGLPLDGTLMTKSPEALVRRLDQLTCQGCHQSRTLAGFHVLGAEDDAGGASRLNRIAVGTSPHFNGEIAWRTRVLRAVAKGVEPWSVEEPKPFAERSSDDGILGARCGLGDKGFASWTCRPDLKCRDINGEKVLGYCVGMNGPQAGGQCETDRVSQTEDPHAETVTNLDSGDAACAKAIAGGSCSGAAGAGGGSGGFPNGACTGPCKRMGEVANGGVCFASPPSGFNDCMAAGSKPFDDCMAGGKLALRGACDIVHPCREDYVCAFVPGAPKGTGACMPPYFIFQARIDGHQ